MLPTFSVSGSAISNGKLRGAPGDISATPVFKEDVIHYLYINRPDSSASDENTLRSLILANIPINTTDVHLRYLFGSHLNGGLVERIRFQDGVSTPSQSQADQHAMSNKKRKRITVEELERSLQRHSLPDVWGSTVHAGKTSAIVVFVDRPSMEASFKAARKAVKGQKKIVWGSGLQGKIPELGETLYTNHNRLQYPSRQELLGNTDEYLTIYAEMEEAKSRENAKRRQMPDEDGFITVMKGSRGFVRREDAEALAEKAKEKKKGLDNFYRFQMREKRKEEQGELMRKFEEDKQKVQEMKMKRGKLRPE